MLTSEEVREIETIMDDPARRWKMSPGEAITYIEALLEDRAEMQAEVERLQGVNQTYRILVEELREEIERLRAVVEAARHAFNMRPAHYATYRLSYDVVEQPGLYWHASRLAPAMDTLGCALAALEGEA